MQRTTLAVLLISIVLSLLLTYPLPAHLATAVEDRQDALLNVWITAWDGHQLLADPLHLFDANIFYPHPRTLAYSELLLGNALLALPLNAAGGNPVLGYNAVLLLSFVLSALGAYLLVARLTRSPAAGLVAGLAFAFSTYRLTNLAQAQLLTAQWMPFALLAFYGLRRRPGPRPAVALALFFWLQAVSSFYYAIMLALALAGLVAFEGLAALARRRPASARGPRGRVLAPLLLATGGCLLSVLPFALPYFRVQRELGFQRSLADSEPFSASLRQYAMVPPASVIHGHWLPNDATPIAGGYPVDALFPGLAVLALAAWGLLRGGDRRRWFFVLLLLGALILSFGPRLYLAPGEPAGLEMALPYAWLYALVPGFKALRAPVRFDALVSLSLAVLAGYGLAALLARGPGPRHRAGLLAAGCALLVVAESAAWPAARAEPVPAGDELPPVVEWLADGAPEGAILELPMAFTPGGPQLDYQYLSTYHWRPTPDGYSGFIPPAHGQIVYEMARFPSERAVSLLQALDVRLVVLHGGRLAPGRLAEVEAALPAAPDLSPVAAFDAGPLSGQGRDQVYAVAPRASDVTGVQVSVYFPPQALAGRPYTAYLVALNPGSRSLALPPTAGLQPTFAWQREGQSAGEGDVMAAALPLVTSPGGGAGVVALTVEAPPGEGKYRLALGEERGPLGTWQAAAEVEFGAQASLDLPVPARLVAWEHPPGVRAGGDLPVSLEWRALGKIDAYYSVYLKLLDSESNALAGWDGEPGGGQAPTLLWVPGETVADRISLPVPANTPAGEYRLVAGMYRAGDLARCLTLDAGGRPIPEILLGTVRVEP